MGQKHVFRGQWRPPKGHTEPTQRPHTLHTYDTQGRDEEGKGREERRGGKREGGGKKEGRDERERHKESKDIRCYVSENVWSAKLWEKNKGGARCAFSAGDFRFGALTWALTLKIVLFRCDSPGALTFEPVVLLYLYSDERHDMRGRRSAEKKIRRWLGAPEPATPEIDAPPGTYFFLLCGLTKPNSRCIRVTPTKCRRR